MMGVVSRGPVYYDLSRSSRTWPRKACALSAHRMSGAHGQLADPTGFDVSHVVAYLADSFRRPTTWKTFAIFQKAGLIWTNRLPTFCAAV